MIEPGKNFPGEKGFPTPNEIPETQGYLVFRFPQNNEWAGLLLGAAGLLASEYNWFKWGELFPDEAAFAWSKIVEIAPYDTCGCEIPGNVPVFRLNGLGEWEMLTDGEWLPPSGAWAIPAPDARTEPTDAEKRCAAAANAANVLKTMYESITDSFQDGLAQDEAMAVLAAAVAGALIVPVLGELMLAAYLLTTFLMAEAFVIAEFLTSDLWTEEFDAELLCILLNNAEVDGSGVVTFDFSLIQNQITNSLVFDIDLTLAQQRLALQVGYMLQMIGSEGLNIAGGTTAIVGADCDVCPWEFTRLTGGGNLDVVPFLLEPGDTLAVYNALTDQIDGRNGGGAATRTTARWTLPQDAEITFVRLSYNGTDASGGFNAGKECWLYLSGSVVATQRRDNDSSNDFFEFEFPSGELIDKIEIFADTERPLPIEMTGMLIQGVGTPPY